jgi:filamentous hemagglutinin family protein
MTLQSSKLIRQQLTFHYQSKTHLTKRRKRISVFRQLSLSIFCSAVLFPASVVAQITPDNTVPTNVEQTEENMQINGGEREGNNLFHSFDEFSIPEGMEAIFENATDIENIFTRVTGGEVSNINGILTTQGDANFFFINPNGIVFGDNASLNVGGSFIASTADSIQFEDGSEFSATNPSEPILDLTGFSVGLNLGTNPGAITVNGSGNPISRESTFSPYGNINNEKGLSVKPGNILALIGGDINIDGGSLNAESGQVELAAVDQGSLVNFQSAENKWIFNYDEISNFKNIELTNDAFVNASGNNNSFIQLNASTIKLTSGSSIIIQNNGQNPSGNINISAAQSLIIAGGSSNVSFSKIAYETISEGNAANINIFAQDFMILDGGSILNATFGAGNSGNIEADISNSAQLFRTITGSIAGEQQITGQSTIASFSVSSGSAGDVILSAEDFRASNGATLASSSFGGGKAGNITLKATSIKLDGLTEEDRLFTSINSTTFGSGASGNIEINTSKLILLNGSAISSDSKSDGNAGNLVINASDSIEASGIDPRTDTSTFITSSVTIEQDANFQALLGLPKVPSGNGGNIIVNTPIINISQEGSVSVRNEGDGNAGTLTINAEDINLDNSGSITAASTSGNGGNINIDTDNLQIDNESQITTEAGNEGDGGNITINTSNLTAKKNSNLTTSAVGGDGGNINITADTILGLDNSDITANAVGGNGGNIRLVRNII